ncbi:alpha/beta hydrolase [Roseomonas sp. OT10]|uniref:alpha/beta fold hydrolase n=1 Tax=Roseomonas cutis TaxID=2897332 RepID=UPI001E5FF3A8|nr:alpha/beta hydrolase [Roseomonas sp. OT10]UFN50531.1 alpha/beta hydrolase [Roseomonas sp. OT10]
MLGIASGSVPRRQGRYERAGARLYWEATGSGPALVLAHGLGGSHLSWWQQVPAFADRCTVVTFAHRGFHPSTDAAGTPDPGEYAGDLLGLLDHLGIGQAVLVGQSMGGWSCLEVALAAPERVRGLVMSATSGTIAPTAAAGLGGWPERAAAEQAALRERGIHPAMGARAAAEQPALHLLYRHVDDSAALADKEGLRARLMAGRTRPPEDVARLAMPTLFLAGEEDIVFPPAAAVALGERVGRRAEIVPRCGHSPYFERAEAFNAILARFLDALP